MKDKDCAVCYPKPMGISPEGWTAIIEKHEREHLPQCKECGQPIKDTNKIKALYGVEK